MMERLSIEEVIEHCNRHTKYAERMSSRMQLEETPIGNSDYMKQYWEHRQVAEWLEELKELREEKNKFDRNLKFFNEINSKCFNKGYSKAENDYHAQSEKDMKSSYDCGYDAGYNRAIDDFVNTCKEDILCQSFGLHANGIERIAEQLKAGEQND